MKKVIKILLALILTIVAVILIAALFMKKEMDIVREVTINKPKQDVFNYIKYIKNQDNFSKWNLTDPGMKKEYNGTDGTVGFRYHWTSDNKHVGEGEQTIAAIIEGEKVETDLHFMKPMQGNARAFFTTEAIGPAETKVKWGFHSVMPWPKNSMQLFMDMDKMVGDDLQAGLSNLKTVMEKQ